MDTNKNLITLSPLQRLLAGLLVAIFICTTGYFGWFRSLDWIVYDASQRIADRMPADDVVIVAIDEASISELGRWPWSREVHAQLVDRLTAAGAQAVVLDILFSDPQRNPVDADPALAAALARAANVLLPVYIAHAGAAGGLQEMLPLAAFSQAAAGLGHVHFEADEDGVCRSVFLREGVDQAHWSHLAVSLTRFLKGKDQQVVATSSDSGQRNAYIVREDRRLIPFVGVERAFSRWSYLDVLKGTIPQGALQDKVVFVGATAAGLGDRVVTPTSSAESILSGVELNATIFDAYRKNSFIEQLDPIGQISFNFLASLLIVLCSAFLAPRQLLVFTVSSLLGINLIALTLPAAAGVWIAPMGASAACLLSYLFWSLRRMQQALRFLRGELNALAAERSFLHKPQHLDDLYAGLRFIAAIAPVKGWCVVQNGRKLVSWGDCDLDKTDVSEQRVWQHQGGYSSLSMEEDDAQLTILVAWQNGEAGACVRPLFDSLVVNLADRASLQLPKAPEVITHTIQDLQQASHSFKEVSHLAQRSLSRLADGVAITDRSGRLLFENLQFRGLVQSDQENARYNVIDLLQNLTTSLGESWEDLLTPVYLESKTAQCEAVTNSGVHLLCQVHALNTETNDQFVILVLTDISVLKEYEQARTETLNFLSHDLRSPLVSILALIENARSSHSANNDPQLLSAIESYARTNLRFAENFLQLARAEATDSIGFEPVDMHGVLENVVAEVRPLAATAAIKLAVNYCDEDAWVMGNADLLQRAIVNLASNAIKFSESGGMVTLSLMTDANRVSCEIVDQGIGIAENDQAYIFERFNRGSGQASKMRSGTGLGLRLVKVVSDRHGGGIKVTSELAKGSTFTLSLPLITLE